MAPKNLIGILGGMGPAATVDFMSKIVAATEAEVDQDHVPLVVHDVPQIPDRSTAIETGCDAPFLPMLAGLRMLERSGADFIAIPCNTAHYWYERLARSSGTPIIHIADAVCEMIHDDFRPMKLALMATRGTVKGNVYQRRLAGRMDVLLPEEDIQRSIDGAIAAVKMGATERGRLFAEDAAEALLAAGATHLLLACTELPIAVAMSQLRPKCIDATEALARACVAASVGRDSRPSVSPA